MILHCFAVEGYAFTLEEKIYLSLASKDSRLALAEVMILQEP